MNCNFAYALAHFTADYHSGQWSRGYRLNCAIQRWIYKNLEDASPLDMLLDSDMRLYYCDLVDKYADKM